MTDQLEAFEIGSCKPLNEDLKDWGCDIGVSLWVLAKTRMYELFVSCWGGLIGVMETLEINRRFDYAPRTRNETKLSSAKPCGKFHPTRRPSSILLVLHESLITSVDGRNPWTS